MSEMPRKLKRTPPELQRGHCLVWCQVHKRQNQVATSCKASLKRKHGAQPLRRVLDHERVPHLVPRNDSRVCQNIGDDVFKQKGQQVCGCTFSPLTVNLHNTQGAKFLYGGKTAWAAVFWRLGTASRVVHVSRFWYLFLRVIGPKIGMPCYQMCLC